MDKSNGSQSLDKKKTCVGTDGGDDDDECVIIEEKVAKTPKRFKTTRSLSQSDDLKADDEDSESVEDGIIGMKVRSPREKPLNNHPSSQPVPEKTSDSPL